LQDCWRLLRQLLLLLLLGVEGLAAAAVVVMLAGLCRYCGRRWWDQAWRCQMRGVLRCGE
jgi:hypothetical protein